MDSSSFETMTVMPPAPSPFSSCNVTSANETPPFDTAPSPSVQSADASTSTTPFMYSSSASTGASSAAGTASSAAGSAFASAYAIFSSHLTTSGDNVFPKRPTTPASNTTNVPMMAKRKALQTSFGHVTETSPPESSLYPDMEPQIIVQEEEAATSFLEALDDSENFPSDVDTSKHLPPELKEDTGYTSSSELRKNQGKSANLDPQNASGSSSKPLEGSGNPPTTLQHLPDDEMRLEPQEEVCSRGPPSDCDSDEVDLLKVMKRRRDDDEPPPDTEVLPQEDLSTTDEDDEDEFTVHFAHTGRKTGE